MDDRRDLGAGHESGVCFASVSLAVWRDAKGAEGRRRRGRRGARTAATPPRARPWSKGRNGRCPFGGGGEGSESKSGDRDLRDKRGDHGHRGDARLSCLFPCSGGSSPQIALPERRVTGGSPA